MASKNPQARMVQPTLGLAHLIMGMPESYLIDRSINLGVSGRFMTLQQGAQHA